MEKTNLKKPHYLWWILIACCAIQAGSQGTIFDTAGVFNNPVCSSLNFSVGKFSLCQTFSAVAMMISQPLTSTFYEKFGLKKVLLVSGIFYYLSEFLLSMSFRIWHWYILLAIQGVAGGFFYRTSYTILICRWFASKTAAALGIATAIGSVAGMLINPLASIVIGKYGWRICYVFLAAIGSIITIPIIALKVENDPQTLGMKPFFDGTKEDEDLYFPGKYDEVKKRRICLILIVCYAVAYFCGGYYSHLPNYCVSTGMGLAAGSIMTSFELGGTMIMKFIIGPLLDKIGFLKTELLLFILSFIGYLSYFVVKGEVLFFTTALCGIFCATNMVLMPLFARDQVGEECFQQILPWMTTLGAAISSLSNTLYGFIFDFQGNYNLMFMLCILSIVVSFALILLIKRIEFRYVNAEQE